MILCRVIGNAVSSIQHPAYDGKAVMVVQPVKTDTHTPTKTEFLAVDAVQAGPGDLVLVAREGNTARQILRAGADPLHSVIVGVVDTVDV